MSNEIDNLYNEIMVKYNSDPNMSPAQAIKYAVDEVFNRLVITAVQSSSSDDSWKTQKSLEPPCKFENLAEDTFFCFEQDGETYLAQKREDNLAYAFFMKRDGEKSTPYSYELEDIEDDAIVQIVLVEDLPLLIRQFVSMEP